MKEYTYSELMQSLSEIRYAMDYIEKPFDTENGWYIGDKCEEAIKDAGHGYTIYQIRSIIFMLRRQGFMQASDYRVGGGRFIDLLRITKKGRTEAMRWASENGMKSDWYLD